MEAEEILLCRLSILAAIEVSGRVRKKDLSLDELPYIVHLLESNMENNSKLSRYRGTNFFQNNEYEVQLLRLENAGYIVSELRSRRILYGLTEKGIKFMQGLTSQHIKKILLQIESIFNSLNSIETLRRISIMHAGVVNNELPQN